MIYFDNAATTKPIKESLDTFININNENFFNVSAGYSAAFDLSQKIKEAKKEFLNILGDDGSGKIIFTSGATESNNLSFFGCASSNKTKKILVSIGEHPSVFNCAMELKNKGYSVEFIPLQKNGQVDYKKFEEQMDENVFFVSTMFVNNETGAINDLVKIRKIIDNKNPNCFFHVDAVQGFGKIKLNVNTAKINLCSISAHKIGGIKGVGALYISKNTKIKNINFGGGQEDGFRSGTVNASGNLSFLTSAQNKIKDLEDNFKKVLNLKIYLIKKLKELLPDNLFIVSDEDEKNYSPYIVSLLFVGFRGEIIMRYLSSKNICVGTGSACSTSKVGNRILENMGYNKNQIMGALRISFCSENTIEEIEKFLQELKIFINEFAN